MVYGICEDALASRPGSSASLQGIPETFDPWAKAFQSFGSTTARDIESTSSGVGGPSSCRSPVETNGRSPRTSPGHTRSPVTFRIEPIAMAKTSRYDVAEHLRTPEEMAAYLEACLEEAGGDAAFIAKALGDIARAHGMTDVAREAGLSRESLYKALSGERVPSFETVLKVIGALGLTLHAGVRPRAT